MAHSSYLNTSSFPHRHTIRINNNIFLLNLTVTYPTLVSIVLLQKMKGKFLPKFIQGKLTCSKTTIPQSNIAKEAKLFTLLCLPSCLLEWDKSNIINQSKFNELFGSLQYAYRYQKKITIKNKYIYTKRQKYTILWVSVQAVATFKDLFIHWGGSRLRGVCCTALLDFPRHSEMVFKILIIDNMTNLKVTSY